MQLNNNIHRIVRRVLNEELGINQEVYDASNQVFELIQTDFKKHNIHGIELNDVNGKVYSNMVEFFIHSKKVNILYKFYYFDTENDYLAYKKQNPSITQAETNTTDNADEFLIKVNYLITYLGDANNGYYQFINQIISYVFLAQAGFCEAVIYSLYKPFAEKNKDDINAIYGGARKVFRIIGFIILGIIFLVTLGLHLFYNFEEGYKVSALICFFIISTSYLISYFGKGQTYMAV